MNWINNKTRKRGKIATVALMALLSFGAMAPRRSHAIVLSTAVFNLNFLEAILVMGAHQWLWKTSYWDCTYADDVPELMCRAVDGRFKGAKMYMWLLSAIALDEKGTATGPAMGMDASALDRYLEDNLYGESERREIVDDFARLDSAFQNRGHLQIRMKDLVGDSPDDAVVNLQARVRDETGVELRGATARLMLDMQSRLLSAVARDAR